ncbi:MAG: hypothetical protein QGF74_03420 [Candidatus Nanoarchaeia archaeon]|jgi:hypothetical protein|nr:hypothetical protein [Candidatus Nanoarchaeia archaeon]|tara:strand:- start:11471 stop:11671 length:201 start_codon:yes stop_codon:yes gene_type:complete
MSLIDWYNSNLRKLDVWDIGFIKLSVAAAVLLLAKYWAPILNLEWYWYVIIFVIATIRPLSKFFKQ